jgi:5-aminopentanamidase
VPRHRSGRSRPLRVTALELPARFGDPAHVLAEADALLARGPTDVALLPEASLTGYVSADLDADLTRFAEPIDGPSAARLAALARAHATHLVGPLVLREDERVYNAMVAFDPEGRRLAVYRKRHPWYPETWATPGTEPLARFRAHGAAFAIAVCFDLHFLERESTAELGGADVLLFPSAWVEAPDSRPHHLARLARAFGVAIVNANWGIGEPAIKGQGGSRIVGSDGGLLVAASRARTPQRIDAEIALPFAASST